MKEKEDGFDQAWAGYEKALSFNGISEEIQTKADAVKPIWEDFRKTAEEIVRLRPSRQTADNQQDTVRAVDAMEHGQTAVSEGARSVDALKETFDRIQNLVNSVHKFQY